MKKFLSRYRLGYPRSLVYMLQATEYQPADFLAWTARAATFAQVEKRGQLKFTTKARLVLLIVWTVYLKSILLISWLWLASGWTSTGQLAASLLVVLIMPITLPYALALLIALSRYVIERPLELGMTWRVRRQLRAHTATKVAIAGSYGKTSFKEILKVVLGESKDVAATPGNLNTPIGIARFVKSLHGNEEVLIFELGEYYLGDIKKLARMVAPDIGIITGINEAHLSKFKSVDRAGDTIFELADYLDRRPLYLNGEDPRVSQRAAKRHLIYSRRGCDGWAVKSAKTSLAGTELVIKDSKKVITARSKLLGLHQVGPLTAAVAVATRLGVDSSKIAAGLAKTQPFEHRLQPQQRQDKVTIIDDTYNGSPDGVKAAIEFLKLLKAKRKIYVTPGLVEMGERDQEIHQDIGRQLAPVTDMVILIRNSVTPAIAAGLQQAGFSGQLKWFDEASAAYRALDSFTRSGDVVLMQNDWPDQYA